MTRDILPLDHVLRNKATKTPHKTFIKFEGKKFSYREVDRLADIFAAYLQRHGMKPGSKIALLAHNCPQYIAAYFGIIRGGGIVLPLNNLLTNEEINYILNDSGAVICIYDSNCAETVRKLVEANSRLFVTFAEITDAAVAWDSFEVSRHSAEDISTILYTSGTTGRPKGASLSHRNILVNAMAAIEVIKVTNKDKFVVFLPLFHSFTYTVCVIIPLITGALISH
jgi:long-chain acyl-CoA synthetase